MKKQYLISLLGLAAISISFGSSFSSITSLTSSSINEESNSANNSLDQDQLNTIEEYEDEFPTYSIEQIEMGNYSSAAVINDGTGADGDHLYTWGDNTYGQLGLGNNISYDTPQEVTSLPAGDIEDISMEYNSTGVIINIDGEDSLYTWGYNRNCQLGNDNVSNSNVPGKITKGLPYSFETMEQINMGYLHSGIIIDNKIYTWGDNSVGQMGNDGLTENYAERTPNRVPNTDSFKNQNVEEISLGSFSTAAVVKDGSTDHLYTWGLNDYGQLGLGDAKNDYDDVWYVPAEVTSLPEGDIEQIAMGYNYSAAVANGDLYTWGDNKSGQLGLGVTGNPDEWTSYYNSPQKVTLLPAGDIKQISMGGYSSSAITNDADGDHLYTWGNNKYGQLGNGEWEEYPYSVPEEVIFPSTGDFKQVSMGVNHCGMIIEKEKNDHLYVWGDGGHGELGLGADIKMVTTPQTLWTTPYIDSESVSSEVVFSEKDIEEATIEYDFETSLDVQNVDISVWETSDPEEIRTITSNPIASGEDGYFYKGEAEFNDLNVGSEYMYEIDINYLTYNKSNIESYNLIQDSFIHEIVQTSPDVNNVYARNITNTSTEIYYDLETGFDEYNKPYKLEKIIINDENSNKLTSWTFDEGDFTIDEYGNGSVLITDLDQNTTYHWDITFEFKGYDESIADEIIPFTTLKSTSKVTLYTSIAFLAIIVILIVLLIISTILLIKKNHNNKNNLEISKLLKETKTK